MRDKLIIILLFCVLSTGVQAQSRWGIFAGGGTTWYYGDIGKRAYFTKLANEFILPDLMLQQKWLVPIP